MKYRCFRCIKYETIIKTSYVRHLKRKNSCQKINNLEIDKLLEEIQTKSYINRFENREISEKLTENEELQKLNELEIKEIKDKYNKLKREVRKKYKDKMPKKTKTKRIKVPKKLKNMIWDKNIGKTFGVGNCYCCSEEIDSKNFEAGHIISVKYGGETILDNLKPICSCCNKSMGAENLEIFKQKYMKKTPNHCMYTVRKGLCTNVKKLYNCKYCTKKYKHRQSKFKHEKICKKKHDEEVLKNQNYIIVNIVLKNANIDN